MTTAISGYTKTVVISFIDSGKLTGGNVMSNRSSDKKLLMDLGGTGLVDYFTD